MVYRRTMCSSAAWLWAGPLLLLLLCSHAGPAAARPQAQERTERGQSQQAQQVQQRQQGTQGQQGQQDQQFFPLLALIGSRWFSQLSRQQQQREQQQQQQQLQPRYATTTTTTTTTSSVNAAMQPAADPAMGMPVVTATAPMPTVLTATKPAVPAGEVLVLDTPAAAGAADAPAAEVPATPAVAAPPTPMAVPTMVDAAVPDPQQQQPQQQMQPQPVSVDVTAVIPPDQSDPAQPEATSEEEPLVDESQGYEGSPAGEEATAQPAAPTLLATPAPAPAPAPQVALGGRSAAGPLGNAVPVSSSSAKVQSPRVVSEVAPSGRPVVIPVNPLSDVVPRNNGQQPRRRRRQPASPAVPAILPLTEVLPKQQVQLAGQSMGA